MLEEIVKATELKEDDTMQTAVIKGLALGVVEGILILGATHVLHNIFGSKKDKK